MTIHVDPDDTNTHAVYAPSSSKVWTKCTAQAEAVAMLPPQEDGEEAAEGTAAHDEIERVLRSVGDGEPYQNDVWGAGLVGDPDPDHPAAFGVALLLDYVRKLPPGRLWIEQRVALTPQIWGRCDVAHFSEHDGILTIVDYKNGFGPVDAEENSQTRIYGGGTAYKHQLPVRWVRHVIVQPNDWRPVPRVKQWIEPRESLEAFIAKTVQIPNGLKEFVAGEHCRYCPLFGQCSASSDLISQLATVMQHAPDQIRPEQWKIFKALEKPIADWFKTADKIANKKALSGTDYPGMMIVTAQKNRAWKDEAAARAAIVAQLGVDALKLPTPAQAEDMGMDVSTLADRPQGVPVLAFDTDKRPKWERRSVTDMFAGVVPK